MKIAHYKTLDGKDLEVEYDENAPCIVCGLPVENASVGGTAICPSCDCGVYRDGTEIRVRDYLNKELLKKKAKEIYEKFKDGEKMKNRTIEEKIISRILKLEERVKKLEQAQTYFPMEYPNQVGGVDNIIIEKEGLR